MKRIAQGQHYQSYPHIVTFLNFCLSYCTTIPGPRGPSLWSHFKWSPYSTVLRSETINGCSRSLLDAFSHKKNVSLLLWKLYALVCVLALLSVQSLPSMCEAHLVLRPLSRWMAEISFREPVQTSDSHTSCWAGFQNKPGLLDLWHDMVNEHLGQNFAVVVCFDCWSISPQYGSWIFSSW